MQKKQLPNGMIDIIATKGKYLHRTDTDLYVGRVTVTADTEQQWEEVDSKPAYTKEEYDREVERLIALRYTTGQEIQFAREKETAGEKYTRYLEYVEECKANAIANLETAAANSAQEENESTPIAEQ